MRRVAAVCMALLLAGACVERAKPVDKEYVKKNLLSAAPTPKVSLNADLGGKIVYIGADVDHDTLRPGDKVKIVHYWKVVAAPGSEWRPFTHIEGTTPKDWMNVDATKMRANHPVASWKAGEIIRDEQTVTLNKDWTSPTATIYVGLYRKGSSSVGDRMPIKSGPNDGKNRLRVVRIPIQGKNAPPPTKTYVIRKAAGKITIDGKADEADWKKAPSSGAFVNTQGGQALGQSTTAKLLYDDKYLYAFVDVKDNDVYSPYKKRDDSLWKADDVEMFIDADRNRRGYVELQVNPNNAQFDSWFATTRAGGGDPAWNSGMTSAVHVDGTAGNQGDTDQGWQVEVAIPLAAVKGKDAKMAVRIPPQPGDHWRLNVVRIEKNKDKSMIAASSWSQIPIQDFHALNRMLEVTFADADGNVPKAQRTAAPKFHPMMPNIRLAPLTPAGAK